MAQVESLCDEMVNISRMTSIDDVEDASEGTICVQREAAIAIRSRVR
jgi:hypothetical protein